MYERQRNIAMLRIYKHATPHLEQGSSAATWLGLNQCVKCCDSFLRIKCWHNSTSTCQM